MQTLELCVNNIHFYDGLGGVVKGEFFQVKGRAQNTKASHYNFVEQIYYGNHKNK